jgi:hypothetical protein
MKAESWESPVGGQLHTFTAKSFPLYNSCKRKRKAARQMPVVGSLGAVGEPNDNHNASGGRGPERNQVSEQCASELLKFEQQSMQAAQGMCYTLSFLIITLLILVT